jgi:hypothetical protein
MKSLIPILKMSEAMVASREWEKLDEVQRTVIRNHQQNLPIRLSSLAKELGVSVQASTLKPGISGELRPGPAGGYVIRVNRHESSTRQRFTVAHEIAHFLLHRDHIGTGISDDVLYRSGLSDQREAEANRLAADILMPIDLVRHERFSVEGLGDDEMVQRLASQFGVSESAMRIRLGM